MASSELEEKIEKIRLQNEKIRQRYEEVEADKKNAAKLNALVQLVPSDDWPERKEPPEFSAPPKSAQKQKVSNKEYNERPSQHYSGVQDRLSKKDHKFAQGDGPPPDPKYNFLADSERETRHTDDKNDEDKNRSRNKATRGAPRRRGAGGGNGAGGPKEAYFKDNRGPHAFHSKEESLPEYEAWRAERNRIDEARINRQKTAEGNWRREWDVNKVNIEKDPPRKNDSNRKDSNTYDRRNNYDNDYSNRGHGGNRTFHGSQKNHGHQDYRRQHHEQTHEYKRQSENKQSASSFDDRTVTAIDKNIKVTVNHGNPAKGPMMSVKVNSPSIAGTGRVGPRQKSRITYSSQSDADVSPQELNFKQKSFDEKTAANFTGAPKSTPKSPFSQRKKEGNSKSPYPQRKEFRNDDSSTRSKTSTRTSNSSKTEFKDQKQSNQHTSKIQRTQKRTQKSVAETMQNIPSSDDALPSEYNPNKFFDYERIAEQKVDNENDDIEKFSNEVNQTIEKSSEVAENSVDTSSLNYESVNQTTYSIHTESSDEFQKSNEVEENKVIEINKNIEDSKIDESNDENVADIKSSEKINSVTDDIIVNDNESSQNVDIINENININEIINETVPNISNDTLHVIDDQKDNKNMLQQSEQDELIEESNISIDNKEIVKTIPSSEEDTLLLSTEENKNGIKDSTDEATNIKIENEFIKSINQEKVEEQSTNNVFEETSNDESHQKSTDLKNSSDTVKLDTIANISVESKESNPINSEISQNISFEDSGILDSNDSYETKASDLNSSKNLTANDSGLTDDFVKNENDSVSMIEPASQNDMQNSVEKSIESDPVDLTKEISKKSTEICDNDSATPSVTDEAVENLVKKSEDNQKTNDISENPTKDNDIDTVKNDTNMEESDKLTVTQEVIENESTKEGISVKEELSVGAEGSKTD